MTVYINTKLLPVVLLILLVADCFSQTIPVFSSKTPSRQIKPAASGASKKPVGGSRSSLLIVPDMDCYISVDGQDYGVKNQRIPFKVAVQPGDHIIFCITTDGKDTLSQVVSTDNTGQKISQVELAVARNKRITSEQVVKQPPVTDERQKKQTATDNLRSIFPIRNQDNNIEKIKQFLLDGADVNFNGDNGCALIAFAYDNVPFLKLIINQGGSTNCLTRRTTDKSSLWDIALYKNETDFFEFLLEKGADVNLKDEKGQTALQYVIMPPFLGIYPTTFPEKRKQRIAVLLKKGANPNVADDEGNTLLFETITSNELDIAELLLNNGADVNARNVHGYTPLKDAEYTNKIKNCNNCHVDEFIKLFKKYGGHR